MKTGLVMEGGAMRGMFTAGVTDVFMENGVTFDGAIGVSAGAAFGCNYKSHQPGRAIRYNKRFCGDKRFVSLRSLLVTGDLYGADFGYREIPNTLDPFDHKAFASDSMEFYVVCTDMTTGSAVYHRLENGDAADIEWMRASASMPFVSRPVKIGERLLSDGGTADSIPIRYLESLGYDRCVVILTQPEGFVKKKNQYLPLLKLAMRKYPALVSAIETRHERYNDTLAYISEKERSGDLLVIRPFGPLKVGAVERDPHKLEEVYQTGRREARMRICEIKRFLSRKQQEAQDA